MPSNGESTSRSLRQFHGRIHLILLFSENRTPRYHSFTVVWRERRNGGREICEADSTALPKLSIYNHRLFHNKQILALREISLVKMFSLLSSSSSSGSESQPLPFQLSSLCLAPNLSPRFVSPILHFPTFLSHPLSKLIICWKFPVLSSVPSEFQVFLDVQILREQLAFSVFFTITISFGKLSRFVSQSS